ncbi:MAG: amidohydrolase family protein [Lachnospiraceae bacterium]|jgi:dihydroorotase
MKVDYLIRNGRVIDPANGTDEVKDIAVVGSRIVDLTEEPETDWLNGVIDAKGCIVTPGLIDFHAHMFHEGSFNSVRADFLPADGVTAAVDAGTAGTANYESFYKDVASSAAIHVRSYLSPHPLGQASMAYKPSWDYTKYDMKKLGWLLDQYSGQILGLKMVDSKGMVPEEKANEYLDKLIEIAAAHGVGVCVHTTDPPVPVKEIAGRLRKGDIYAHCYQGKGDTIIGEDGKVKPEIRDARERGVLFDAANGYGNFGMEVCRKALADGFLPDIISTDATIFFSRKPYYMKNLPTLMSKYAALGMNLTDIVRAVTIAPAKAMGLSKQIGHLSPGAQADIAILKWKEKSITFKDCLGASVTGSGILIPQLTMLGGEIAYCQSDFYTEC